MLDQQAIMEETHTVAPLPATTVRLAGLVGQPGSELSEVVPMTKTTFYFVIAVLILTDVVQGRYQKRWLRAKAAHLRHEGGSVG